MRPSRFSVVPVLAWILKILAILLLVLFVEQAIWGPQGYLAVIQTFGAPPSPFGAPSPQTVGDKFNALLGPTASLLFAIMTAALLWGAADLLRMLRQLALTAVGAATPRVDTTPGNDAV